MLNRRAFLASTAVGLAGGPLVATNMNSPPLAGTYDVFVGPNGLVTTPWADDHHRAHKLDRNAQGIWVNSDNMTLVGCIRVDDGGMKSWCAKTKTVVLG